MPPSLGDPPLHGPLPCRHSYGPERQAIRRFLAIRATARRTWEHPAADCRSRECERIGHFSLWEDLAAAVHAFNELGYSVDVLSIDTRRFIPQSRPRLFLVGLQNPPAAEQFDSSLRPDWLQQVFADTSLRTHRAPLPEPPSP